ncbi:hypothetical protein BASA81_015582 [Batrachochytrium salamandrivorans]|nr:hypothetical protein BASA81_015582 [Batrachochytrium salamandrivorans]
MQSDPALDQFRVRSVRADHSHTASAFLAKFQSTAASLEADEKIKLVVAYPRESSMELVKAVLSDPQASRICALCWECNEEEDVSSIVPLLTNNCPELVLLLVDFEHRSAFDFVSGVLEHPCTKVKVLELRKDTMGDIPRFFAALEQSQVSALTFFIDDSPELAQGLFEYLAKDLLVRFMVRMSRKQVPSELMMSLVDCARLVDLEMMLCHFSQPTALTHLPKFLTKLTLLDGMFVDGFDWSFLATSNVRELDLLYMKCVDGSQLGGALAVHLKAKGLDRLRFYKCDFANEALAVAGAEFGRIKSLELTYCYLNDASIKLVAIALESPNNELRELKLEYKRDTASSIEDHLVPALRHPNCNLEKLSLLSHGKAAKAMEDFRKRRASSALL